jgi:hypothetical protein
MKRPNISTLRRMRHQGRIIVAPGMGGGNRGLQLAVGAGKTTGGEKVWFGCVGRKKEDDSRYKKTYHVVGHGPCC